MGSMVERRQHSSRREASFTSKEVREIRVWRRNYEVRKKKRGEYPISIDEARAMISD